MCTYLSCAFDGSGSTDSDGTVASYAWNFGDGTSAATALATHVYAAGTYTATLIVTDNLGATSAAASVTVTPKANVAPTADAQASCRFLTCSFDGSGSTDSDGSLASYAWDFGDGSSSTSAVTSHTFSTPGPHTATLVVTDDQAASSAPSSAAVDLVANVAPTAAFTSGCTAQACSFDATGSQDGDGSITSYAWDFGDGTTGTGASPTHSYAQPGTFTVVLTVTDDQGASSVASGSASPTAAPNQAPTAVFASPFCSLLACSVNGSGSTDPDGSIVSYSWDFGDGLTATGPTPSHTYSAGGTYNITLTVTDNQGATATAGRSVSVSPFFAVDAFARAVASGWGTADLGGLWATASASNFSVSGGVGH